MYEVSAAQGPLIILTGLHSTPVVIGNNPTEICSYLNELEKNHNEWVKAVDELLYASLTHGVTLLKAQDKVARMLQYPGIDGFIKERFSKPVVERKKEESITDGTKERNESGNEEVHKQEQRRVIPRLP